MLPSLVALPLVRTSSSSTVCRSLDVSTPTNPLPRAILDFSSFGDDNGTGIAVDSAVVYLTTDRSRLLVGQYLALEDLAGIPPTVRIAAPAPAETVVEGAILSVTVEATDDVTATAVTLLVNGTNVSTDTAAPYQFTVTVPAGVSSLTLGATANDLGGNSGIAQNVTVNVIPDPLTTVIGTVVDPNGNPLAGATVKLADGRSGVTGADGSFSFANVPTVAAFIQVTATFATPGGTILSGKSNAIPPVRAGTTDVGQIQVFSCLLPPSGLVA